MKKWKPFTKKDFVPLEEFIKYCRDQNIKSSEQFKILKRPENIPSNPNKAYKGQWKGWAYVTKSGGDTRWMPFKEARKYVRSLKLNGRRGWLEWEKSGQKPDAIPANPYICYGNKWKGWQDFIGNAWTRYPKSKLYAIASKIRLARDWNKKGLSKYGVEKPHNIPLTIKHVYPEYWEGLREFLGNNQVSYGKFKEFIIKQGFTKGIEYHKFLKENPQKGIRLRPKYKEWKGWMHFKKTQLKS